MAAWDVGAPPSPEFAPDIRLRFNGAPETLGPDGDRRKKVEAANFAPGGKYRGELHGTTSICWLLNVPQRSANFRWAIRSAPASTWAPAG